MSSATATGVFRHRHTSRLSTLPTVLYPSAVEAELPPSYLFARTFPTQVETRANYAFARLSPELFPAPEVELPPDYLFDRPTLSAIRPRARYDLPRLSTELFPVEAPLAGIAVLTGTIITGTDANHIRDGGRRLTTTLEDATFKPAGTGPIGSTEDTFDYLEGLVSDVSEAFGWNAVVRLGLTPANVTRLSDTEVEVVFPPFPSYAITTFEFILQTVPTSVLATGDAGGDIEGDPDFRVSIATPVPPADPADFLFRRRVSTYRRPDPPSPVRSVLSVGAFPVPIMELTTVDVCWREPVCRAHHNELVGRAHFREPTNRAHFNEPNEC